LRKCTHADGIKGPRIGCVKNSRLKHDGLPAKIVPYMGPSSMRHPTSAARKLPLRMTVVAALLVAYPALGIFLLIQSHGLDELPPRAALFFILEVLGLGAAFGVLMRNNWWAYFAITFGFVLVLYAFTTATAFDVVFYGALGLGLIIFVSRNPAIEDAAPLGASQSVAADVYLVRNDEAAGSNIMPAAEQDLDALKYRLEREKFDWQKASHQADSSIFNRHFGVIITTIISVAAVIVSLVQLNISANNTKSQIDNEKVKNDRQFYLEAARFLLTYETDLKTDDPERVRYFRDVVVASFPPDLAEQIATTMHETARTSDARKLWEDGLFSLRRRATPSSKK
jgi:hypothetical protein